MRWNRPIPRVAEDNEESCWRGKYANAIQTLLEAGGLRCFLDRLQLSGQAMFEEKRLQPSHLPAGCDSRTEQNDMYHTASSLEKWIPAGIWVFDIFVKRFIAATCTCMTVGRPHFDFSTRVPPQGKKCRRRYSTISRQVAKLSAAATRVIGRGT